MTHRLTVLGALLVAMAVALVGAQSSFAHGAHHGHHQGRNVVFVQTNQPDGNQIVVFDRRHDGRLDRAGTYPTGGLGGTAAPGLVDAIRRSMTGPVPASGVGPTMDGGGGWAATIAALTAPSSAT